MKEGRDNSIVYCRFPAVFDRYNHIQQFLELSQDDLDGRMLAIEAWARDSLNKKMRVSYFKVQTETVVHDPMSYMSYRTCRETHHRINIEFTSLVDATAFKFMLSSENG